MNPADRDYQARVKANDRKLLAGIVGLALIGACAAATVLFLTIFQGGG